MAKFKVGDTVQFTSNPEMYPIGVVESFQGDDWFRIKGVYGNWTVHLWSKVDDEADKAISLLTSLGYDVTPPKPKLTGKAVVWYFKDQVPSSYHVSDMSRFVDGDDKIKLAIVDWTEGDGVNV